MRDIDLFQLALNLTAPREVVSVDFDADKKRLDILLDFPKGRVSEDFAENDGRPDAVEESCCDMSPAFISGIGQYLPKSQITFDKFHVMKVINNAMDEVRHQEQKNHPELKKTRYIWLKNSDKLKKNQSIQLEELKIPKLNLKSARGYRSSRNYITMIYPIAGKLDYTLPT